MAHEIDYKIFGDDMQTVEAELKIRIKGNRRDTWRVYQRE